MMLLYPNYDITWKIYASDDARVMLECIYQLFGSEVYLLRLKNECNT